ncbi:hypothetical protein [Flavobacterium sp.]|uniref:hypothetical protein n=1 Tax=Flavobacterium sp. TaxID=239 RepID=UPI0038D237D4
MNELESKIKSKLKTLVENKINEAGVPPGGAISLESLIAKYGSKFINLFGDDVVRAAEANMGDDVVKLLGKSVDDATLLTIKNGEKAFITQSGQRNVPLRWLKEDMMKINIDPSKYDEIVGRYANLRLKNGTLIKDFFAKPKPLPKPGLLDNLSRRTKTIGNEFVRGFKTKTGIGTLYKLVRHPFKSLFGVGGGRFKKEDWIRLGGWLGSGVGDANEVIRNLTRIGVKDKILYTIVNIGGQFAGRVWWWTWRLTLVEFIYDLVLDWNDDQIKYEDFASSIFPRIQRAWTFGGLTYVVPWRLVQEQLGPILDYIFKGGGKGQTIKKTELMTKLGKLMDSFKVALNKLRGEADKKYQENKEEIRSKVDSLAQQQGFLPPDTTSLLNTPIDQTQQVDTTSNRPQRQQAKPKFVNPFEQ